MRHVHSLTMVAALVLSACGGGGGGDVSGGTGGHNAQGQSGSPAASYTVELNYQRSQTINKEMVGLLLTGIEDSRCRVGQVCVTAGDIKLNVNVSLPGIVPESRDVQLSSADKQGVKVREYTLSLVRVDPTPAPQNLDLSRYVVTVLLDRTASGGG